MTTRSAHCKPLRVLAVLLTLLSPTMAAAGDFDPLGVEVNFNPLVESPSELFNPLGGTQTVSYTDEDRSAVVTDAALFLPLVCEEPADLPQVDEPAVEELANNDSSVSDPDLFSPVSEPDRAVLLTADWCPHCVTNKPKLEEAFKALRAQGWRIGTEPTDHFQIIDLTKFSARESLPDALDGEDAELPLYVMIEDGEVVRRLAPGCTTPLDQWSLSWLYKGVDENPKPYRESATVASTGHYPLRGSWWSVEGDWNPTKSEIVNHMLTGSRHNGKFNVEWLNSLTYHELQSVHSDDHQNVLKLSYVNNYAAAQTQPRRSTTTTTRRQNVGSYCPTCPTSQRWR